MNSFFDGFMDGFTGAGMFLGPKSREDVSLFAEDGLTPEEQWMDSIHELLQTMASRSSDQQRSEITREIRELAQRTSYSDTVVESGSQR